MEIEKRIIKYIEVNSISQNVIAEVLDIDIEKFSMEREQSWSAEEMLQICAYLGIAPEKI